MITGIPTKLCSAHESTKEYLLKGTLRFGNGDVQFRPNDVDHCSEESGHRTLGTADNRVHKVLELEVEVISVRQMTTLRGGVMTEAMVDYINGGVDEMADDAS